MIIPNTPIKPKLRTLDKWGSGEFGASRGKRYHKGIDYACNTNDILLSDVDGMVERHGWPYFDDPNYRIVNIRVDDDTRVRYFYVDPLVDPGQTVKKGDILGRIQDLSCRYPGITIHYHLQIELDRVPVHPQNWLDNYGI